MNNKKQRKYPVRDKMLVEKMVAYTPRELPTALFRIPSGMHRSVESKYQVPSCIPNGMHPKTM
jgi:hypothetical protein